MSENIKQIVGSLWIGNELSNMEIMSINSFLKNGYEYHLYIYDKVDKIPEGTIIKNGNEILNSSEIFYYNNGSVASFSNQFRFEMIYKTGIIWVDMDLICLKYYDFSDDPYLISSIPNKKYNDEEVAVSILKFPKNDKILLEAIEICKQRKNDILNGTISWGLGPFTADYIVKKYNLKQYVKPWYFSNSCSCNHVDSIVRPRWTTKDVDENITLKYSKRLNGLPDETYFVHLWNEIWRRFSLNKNGEFPNETLYEDLKKLYLK